MKLETTTKLIFAAVMISALSIGHVAAQPAGVPNNPQPPAAPQPAAPQPVETVNEDTEICFFTAFDYKKSNFCVRGEQRTMRVDAIWADRLKSIKIIKDGSVKICNEPNLGGNCTFISASHRELPEEFVNNVHSFRIR